MSTTLPSAGVQPLSQNAYASSFEQNLNVAKSSKILADYLKQTGKSAINAGELAELAKNTGGNVPAEVSSAAAYMARHSEVYTAIETHDVPGQDALSGFWNFEWAADGGLEGTAVGAIAAMTDAFDRAIGASSEITAITTEKKSEIDATKQRAQN